MLYEGREFPYSPLYSEGEVQYAKSSYRSHLKLLYAPRVRFNTKNRVPLVIMKKDRPVRRLDLQMNENVSRISFNFAISPVILENESHLESALRLERTRKIEKSGPVGIFALNKPIKKLK